VAHSIDRQTAQVWPEWILAWLSRLPVAAIERSQEGKPTNSERAAVAGTKFSYASGETQVLGLVLASAIGRPVAEYLEQKIWQPIGAEADATWLVDNSGQEATYCCLNAVLRDYARLGLLLAHDGNWRGRQIIPSAWVMDATTVRADQPHLRATPFFGYGYGYQTWILPGERRMLLLWGVRASGSTSIPRASSSW
jgi:CubicO group peptidase (beta-lactamase class C family)